MKKILLYGALLLGGAASAQTINIPDANFKARLLDTSTGSWIAKDTNGNNLAIDGNSDGEIDQSEALLVGELTLYQNGTSAAIQSLDGIEYFTNLTNFDCGGHSITSLDLTALTNLKKLDCRNNGLQTLNISGLSHLEYLSFEFNKIANFNATGLTNLVSLRCRYNLLTSLDVSNYTALTYLECGNNQLSSLDVSMLSQLGSLICDSNSIATLNITGLQNLESLNYSNNPVPGLDVSALTGLKYLNCNNTGCNTLDLTGFTSLDKLHCSGNPISVLNTVDLSALTFIECNNTLITQLDLSHSPNIIYFHATDNPLLTNINIHNGQNILYPGECQLQNNPNLQFICVDEGEDVKMLEYYEYHDGEPPYMSTDCVFVPDQVYNSISGVLMFDIDENGCDSNDIFPRYSKVTLSDGTNERTKIVGEDGKYFFYVGIGDYTVTPEFENLYFLPTPTEGTISFTALDNTSFVQDFCTVDNETHNDIEVVIIPTTAAQPGFEAGYKIIMRNKGNQKLSGTVTLNFDDSVFDYISAEPSATNILGGVMTWDYTDLLPFENRTLKINLDLNGPTDTPAVNIDDEFAFSVAITPTENDETPEDNSFEFNQIVNGSFDPNNIICLEGETEDPEAIGDYLHYVVNFENTGNAAATFVVITQTIDETMFDMSTLQLLDNSHGVVATINGSLVEYRFDNIDLGAGEQGNIVFKIKTLQTLEEGDEVLNFASIVFDYNFALLTNDAVTVFETVLNNETFFRDNAITVYPNPSQGMINVNAQGILQSLQLFDVQGRLLQTTIENNNNTTLDITNRAAGIYFLKITTEKGSKVEKLIKE